MGRERSLDIPELKEAVQIFFSTFEEVLRKPDAPLPPSSLAVAQTDDSLACNPLEYNLEAMEQLKTVFAPALARYAYVQFCRGIGQLKLKDWLYNAEEIERITMIEELEGAELEFERSIVVSLVHSGQSLIITRPPSRTRGCQRQPLGSIQTPSLCSSRVIRPLRVG